MYIKVEQHRDAWQKKAKNQAVSQRWLSDGQLESWQTRNQLRRLLSAGLKPQSCNNRSKSVVRLGPTTNIGQQIQFNTSNLHEKLVPSNRGPNALSLSALKEEEGKEFS